MPSNTVKFTPEKSPKDKRAHGLGITIFSGVVLVVIVVTFIGAPVVSKVAETPSVVFGTYDGLPIEYLQGNYFAQQVEYLNRFYEQFSQKTDVAQVRQLVWRQAFEQAALQVGLKHEAEKAGIVVTDKYLDSQLVNNANYQQDGAFSEELYRNTAAADRFRYRQETEAGLLIQKFSGDYANGTRLSTAAKNFIGSLQFPQRKFSYVTFGDSDFPADQVKAYGEKNKGLFRTINLSRITINSTEAEAKKIREDAVKGSKPFADLAKASSKDALAETGGALNVRTFHEMKAEIAKAEELDKVFALAKGGISEVIVSGQSWTIYQVVEPARDADLTNQATLDSVKSYLLSNDRGIVEDYLEIKAKEFQVSATTDFVAAAKAIGKTVQATEWVALNFGNNSLLPALSVASKDPVIQGLSSNEDFFKKAFRTAEKAVSAPVLTGKSVVVLRVDAVKTVAETTDTPMTSASVESLVVSDRNSSLQQLILGSAKFKDQFQSEINRLFPQ
jgi:hypothetical protein